MTPASRGSLRAIFRGMALLARGRAEGLNCFGDSVKAFLGSLIPGLGFMAGAVIEGLAEGRGAASFTDVLSPFCALLAPPVIAYDMARLWGREAFWYRYAVIFNWTRWLLIVLLLVMFMVLSLGGASGLIGRGGVRLVVIGLAVYALWLNWFIARHALALTGGRAALLVLGVNLGTLLLVAGPRLLVAGLP